MALLRIAAAQSISRNGDIAANVATHCRFLECAAEAQASLVVFPELSLTGYDLAQLKQNVLHPGDERLAALRHQVRAQGVTAVVGAPLAAAGGGVHIGALVLFPDGTSACYCKQYLHPGDEEQCVEPGPMTPWRHVLGEDVATLAICADIIHAKHARAAASIGATLYLASVLISESGYETDTQYLQRHAEHYGFAVLMANHGAPTGGHASAGRSALWTAEGDLIGATDGVGSQLLVAERCDGVWRTRSQAVETRR